MAESLTTPATLPQTIAENGDATVIPATNDQTEGKASIAYGFPPLTSTPIADGGKMVRRADFNGLFNLLSQYALFTQNGGLFTFNQSVSNAIGGYPLGAQLIYTDTAGNCHIVKSLIPNNTYNFNIDATYIDGAKWGYAFIDTNKANVFTQSQTIAAGTEKGLFFKRTDIATNNTTPVTNLTVGNTTFRANDNSMIGRFYVTSLSSGNTETKMHARRTIGGTNEDCQIVAGVKSDGTTYTSAPTPPSTSRDTNIANTQWISDLLKGSAGNNGWVYLGNKIALQWTYATVSTSGSIVTLPTSFDNDHYVAVGTIGRHSGGSIVSSNIFIHNYTTTGFTAASSSASASSAFFVALGLKTDVTKPT